jgi:class 3 adenylate cyclase/pimeloyl-ACP methyl ester carboxylesterase
VWSGDAQIAYQVFGEGPDLVLSFPVISHIELMWDDPLYARMLRRLATFARVIHFDRRGSGLSSRVPPATLEDEVPDLVAVLDEVGAERPFIFGAGQGGVFSLFFAATYPGRTSGVVTFSTPPRVLRTEDYPWGGSAEAMERLAVQMERGELSELAWAQMFSQDRSADKAFVHTVGRVLRSTLDPRALAEFLRWTVQIDIRDILPTISVPVLVLHRSGDSVFVVEHGRFLGDHIPGARYVELEGDDYAWWSGDGDAVVDEIGAFVTGAPPPRVPDRVLASVLFTDFVDSTRRAVEMGDSRWRQLLDRHDALVTHELGRFAGHQVRATGDGILATFDGPARAVRCACAIRDSVRSIGVELRSGVHTGEIDLRGSEISGIAVHIGQRVQAKAGPGEVFVSQTVTDLVAGSGLQFDERGEHELKGVPGRWRLFAVRA